jgi:Pyruvate/2-oxoacid:ferredoxin oxidoreductase gamma subunit
MVGAFAGATGIVQVRSIIKVLPDFFPPKMMEKNQMAAELGYRRIKNSSVRTKG